MRILVGANVAADPNAGASGTTLAVLTAFLTAFHSDAIYFNNSMRWLFEKVNASQ